MNHEEFSDRIVSSTQTRDTESRHTSWIGYKTAFGREKPCGILNLKPLGTLVCARYTRPRPHRLRLLKEIRRRKKARESVQTGPHHKRIDSTAKAHWANEVTTASALHDGRAPVEELAKAQKLALSEPQKTQTPEAASLHSARENDDASKEKLEADHVDKVTDSSSTSTACTPYEELGSHAQERSPLACDGVTTPRAVGDNPRSSGRNLRKEEAPPPMTAQVLDPFDNSGEGEHFVQRSDASAERSLKTPGVKGTLQMSAVRAGNIKIALGSSDPFLQVKTCDQLRRTNGVAGKGENGRKTCRDVHCFQD